MKLKHMSHVVDPGQADGCGAEQLNRAHPWRLWLWLYVCALAWYWMLWAIFNYTIQPDTAGYLEMGRGIFREFTFGYRLSDGVWQPNACRVPLVPFILGALDRLSGDEQIGYFWFSLLQVMLAPLLPCVAFYFGSKAGRACGWLAYAFLVLHANIIFAAQLVLTDVLFAVSCAVMFITTWRALERPGAGKGLIAGLACGAALMTRPIMKYYWFVAAALTVLRIRPWRRTAQLLAAFSAGLALFAVPWLARNFIHYREPVFDTFQGICLLWSNWDMVEARDGDSSQTAALKQWIIRQGRAGSPMAMVMQHGEDYWKTHDLEVSRELQAVAAETFCSHPGELARRWAANFRQLVISHTHHDELYQAFLCRPLYRHMRQIGLFPPDVWDRKLFHLTCEVTRAMRWSYGALAPLGLMLMLARRPTRFLGIFLGLNILYFCGIISMVVGYDRYRLNMEPLFAALIAYPLALAVNCIISLSRHRQFR
ncbi:MAG: hypothetical protein NTY46_10990 [Candidatus Sumerlaeota bacterium]|nr:hypothetical protein [Candidatus Sumerlaeota bacterium]